MLVLLLLVWYNLFGQRDEARNEFSFLFYNTENFFDTENDSITNDEEFTSEGDRRWTQWRLHTKTERLAKVILAAGKWNPPVLVGLCEIENRDVLELLCRIDPLNRFHYKIVQKDSPDSRGIDVALLYRPELFHPLDYQAIAVVDSGSKSFKTRDILKVSGILGGCDTIHVFVNHWPSRYGGIMETQRYRRIAAETLKKSVKLVQMQYPKARIVCTGDFNDSPTDISLTTVLGSQQFDSSGIEGELVNLSAGWGQSQIQTIKNKFRWEVFDQFIVSDYFLKESSCFRFLNAEIFKAGFLLEPDVSYGGVKPKRTYIGYKYNNGFSDHLPVVLRFNLLKR
jgi:hypothetical protein